MPLLNNAVAINEDLKIDGSNKKVTLLSNGWLVIVGKKLGFFYFFVNKNDGAGFVPLCHLTYSTNNFISDIAIDSIGTKVYFLSQSAYLNIQSYIFDATTVPNKNIYLDTNYFIAFMGGNYSMMGNVDLYIDKENNEIHGAWTGTDSYTRQLFYNKGKIETDGRITWGTVEKVFTMSDSTYPNAMLDCSIIVDSNKIPVIIANTQGIYFDSVSGGNSRNSTYRSITVFRRDTSYSANATYLSAFWRARSPVPNSSNQTQNSPYAIFIPSTINGLPQGRIWITWSGLETGANNTKVFAMYSDDSGVTWSIKSVLGNIQNNSINFSNPAITANHLNQVFLTYQEVININSNSSTIWQRVYADNSWSEQTSIGSVPNSISSGTANVVDMVTTIANPIVLYGEISKILISGKWGLLPQINLTIPKRITKKAELKYNISTPEAKVKKIVEKLDGVVINTYNL